MKILRGIFCIMFVSILFHADCVFAQESRRDTVHFRIRYVINRPEVDSSFVDNSARIMDIQDFLKTVREDSMLRITGVKFRGTASPDGGYEFNRWLSVNRLRTFKELVSRYVEIPDSIIYSNTSDIPWDEFRNAVAESDLQYREEMLAIIDEGPTIVPWFNNRHIDQRLLKLKRLHKGKAWEQLKSPILRDLRYGDAVFEYCNIRPKLIFPPPVSLNIARFEAPEVSLNPVPLDVWIPRLHLKSNVIGLALLSANIAVEADVAPHWSVTLPVYYCAMDYFKSTIKFRNLSVQPELRYWFRKYDNDGIFVGAHFGLSYYNYAFDGEYRYQDYCGRTPAIGGGLAVGYRKPISKNKRWRMEFTAGAGIYPLDYSLFYNTPDVKDGEWKERRKKTYIGLDQIAITFAYSFDIKKWARTIVRKGGRR